MRIIYTSGDDKLSVFHEVGVDLTGIDSGDFKITVSDRKGITQVSVYELVDQKKNFKHYKEVYFGRSE